MKIIGIFVTLFASIQVQAIELRSASDRQLLREVEFRLSLTDERAEAAVLSMYCNRDDFNIELIKSDGQSQTMVKDLYDQDTCLRAVAMNANKKGDLAKLTLVQFCSRDDMHKFVIHPINGIKHSVKDMYDEDTCLRAIGQN